MSVVARLPCGWARSISHTLCRLGPSPPALEEFLHLGEEALMFRAVFGVLLAPPPRTPPAIPAAGASGAAASPPRPGCTCRRAAALRSTENPLPRSRNWSPVCVPGGIFTFALLPSITGTSTSPPSAAWRHAQRHAHEDVGPVALEERMRLHRDMHVEIAVRRALAAGLALAGQPDARAVLDPGRDRDLQAALPLHGARAAAGAAGIADRPARRRRRSGRCARSGRSPAARAPCRRPGRSGRCPPACSCPPSRCRCTPRRRPGSAPAG